MKKTLLIVDDDPVQRRLIRTVSERNGFRVCEAGSGEEALSMLHAEQGHAIALVMLDLRMPGLDGMETLEQIRSLRENMPVIILTAQGGVDTAVRAMRNGACDFFVKPVSQERLVVSINNALSMTTLKSEVSRLKRKSGGTMTFDDIVGKSDAMKQVAHMGARAASSNIPVLITGESGTGKELVARAIQGLSGRAGHPFITVNCGAIPENLVESILFGHEKGSFTGAGARHAGKFREADNGTLFLDEVGELPQDMQVKLLRALQEGEVDPVGSKRPVRVNVRIISATNRDLSGNVRDGTFREDLFYRLNVFPVEIPPLRERPQDIPLLTEHFIRRYSAEEGRDIRGADDDTMNVLKNHPWPGNVRQLENAVFRAVVLAGSPYLSLQDFPSLKEKSGKNIPPAANGQAAAVVHSPATDEEAEKNSHLPEIFDTEGHLRPLEEIEKDIIDLAIRTYSGRMSEIARRLGIGRSTLYRKLRHDGMAAAQH